MKDMFIEKCPFCGKNEFSEAIQKMQGSVVNPNNICISQPLYHLICKNCGSIVRSFVKDPNKL